MTILAFALSLANLIVGLDKEDDEDFDMKTYLVASGGATLGTVALVVGCGVVVGLVGMVMDIWNDM